MKLEQFKNRTMGGSYGNPKTGTFKGQCVSYARMYMEEVLGIPTYPNGDAKDYWNNRISTENFDKVPNPQNGDVVVYGAVPSNIYGHIGIWYNGQLLSQNYDKPLHVSIARLNLTGNRLGYLRKKGSNEMPITKEQEMSCAYMATGSYPGSNYNYPFVGTTNVDGMLTFWQGQMNKISKQDEINAATGATGSAPGKDYSYQFTGQPWAGEGSNMTKFWSGQRQDPSSDEYEEVGTNAGLFQRKKK